MTGGWVEVAFRAALALVAAVAGGGTGFWVAAAWMNLDDREMLGEPFPYLVMTLATGLGAVVAGGLAVLMLLVWG